MRTSGGATSATRSRWAYRSHRWVLQEPVGVVGAITPWNFPHQLNLAKIGPALGAGNTIVLKPAPDTPWCASVVARVVAEETDIPAGVVNVVTSSDHGIGERLVGDERVDLVSFTGSTATGQHVMSVASQTLKRVFLELGGKSACIVLDDADLEAAVSNAAVRDFACTPGRVARSRRGSSSRRARYERGARDRGGDDWRRSAVGIRAIRQRCAGH